LQLAVFLSEVIAQNVAFLMRHFVRTPEKPTKLSDANGATIRGIHLMRGAGGHGRKIKGGTKENAMPKQGTWLRTAAVAAVAACHFRHPCCRPPKLISELMQRCTQRSTI
jgi:hypothetical protein